MRRWEDNIGMVLRTWTNGGLLWTRCWTFGLQNRRGISWL